MPALATIIVSSTLSILALAVGEDKYNELTYESRVQDCVQKVEKLLDEGALTLTSESAELSCRKSLKD